MKTTENEKDVNDVIERIQGFEVGELNKVIRVAVDVKNVKSLMNDKRAIVSFAHGDRVRFGTRDGKTIDGIVNKLNRRTVSLVKCSDGKNRRVPAGLLSKAIS